jgi:hypothetical protein
MTLTVRKIFARDIDQVKHLHSSTMTSFIHESVDKRFSLESYL